jgi:thiol-disulfide isomerase/thioredoxin
VKPPLLSLLVLLSFALGSRAAEPRLKGLVLSDVSGRKHALADSRDGKGVVLLFLGTECPVSNGYTPEMSRLAAAYGPKGVSFLGIHPDPAVTAEAARKHADEYRLGFPVVLDPEQDLARRVGATVVPQAVLLSPAGEVLYRGRIDDRYAPDGKRRDEPRTRDLRRAIEAVLAGKSPPARETKAFGCPLPEPRRPSESR